MPNIRIHEEVAYLYAREHKEFDNKYFYLGVLAPDTPNLNGFGKKEERWTAHQRSKDLDEWENNIKKFYLLNKNNYNKYFIFGYLFHVLTDIVFDRDIYLKVREKILEDNIPLEESHNVMRQDMEYYGSTFKEFEYIKEQLLEVKEFYDILNINKEDLKKWTYLNIDKNIKGKQKYINKIIIDELLKKVVLSLK